MDFDYKVILGVFTIGLAIYGYFDYLKDTIKGFTTPHLYSWIVFLIMDSIAFLIQLGDNAGPGAWGTLVTGLMGLVVVVYAFKNGEKNITISDTISFSVAILCIVFYVLLENPIYSLALVLMISFLAMYPTFRKSWNKPSEETLSLYTIAGIRSAISILATINISLLTIGLPAFIILINSVFIAMVLVRRKQLS